MRFSKGMGTTLISVIIPVYNAERFVEATLRSLCHQTHRDFEALLVIDNKSTDESEKICRNFAQEDPRFRVLKVPMDHGGGVSVNRNVGLSAAHGEYVCFLDSDDLWLPQKLEKQLNFMLAKKSDFSCTAYTKIAEDGRELKKEVHPLVNASYDDVLKDNRIGCLTVMMKSDLAKHLRFHNVMHEDMVFWLEALKKTPVCHGLDMFLAQYRVVKGSRSNNKWIALKGRWNLLTRVEKLPLHKSVFYFAHYAGSAVLKYF